MERVDLIQAIKNYKSRNARNSMGCAEDWYMFAYAMKETFSMDEIENMSQKEIDLLYKLHCNVVDGLY